MIDTMTISYQITKSEYNFLFKIFDDLSMQKTGKKLYKDRNDKNAYVTYALKDLGYQEIKLRWSKKFINYRAIEIKIRPKLVIEKDNYYELLYPNEIEKFRTTFNSSMKNFHLPDLLFWNVKRIDYAMDLNIEQELIPIYMLLFKKANILYFFLANDITKKYMDSSTNLYLYSKNITINYYNRYQTLLNKRAEDDKDWVNFDGVKNKMRLEVQYKNCNGKVIKYLRLKNYKKAILSNYDIIIGNGDYYPLNESLNIITKNTKNVRKRIMMKDIIRLVDLEEGVWKAKEKYVQKSNCEREKALKQFSRVLNDIRRMGINPVSLVDGCGISILQNIKLKIDERICNQEKGIDNLYDPITIQIGGISN